MSGRLLEKESKIEEREDQLKVRAKPDAGRGEFMKLVATEAAQETHHLT